MDDLNQNAEKSNLKARGLKKDLEVSRSSRGRSSELVFAEFFERWSQRCGW